MALDAFKNLPGGAPGVPALSGGASNALQRLANSAGGGAVARTGTSVDERAMQKIQDGTAHELMKRAWGEVELVFFLDESGSIIAQDMENIASGKPGVIAGTTEFVNSVLRKEKSKGANTLVTIVQFDEGSRIIHNRVPINQMPTFKFDPSGGGETHLYNRLAEQIRRFKDMRAAERHPTENVLFAISTDGQDNSGSSPDRVKGLIADRKQAGWNFLFFGDASLDISIATTIGIEHAVSYSTQGKLGVAANGAAVNNVIEGLRDSGKIPANWAQPVINNRISDPARHIGGAGSTAR